MYNFERVEKNDYNKPYNMHDGAKTYTIEMNRTLQWINGTMRGSSTFFPRAAWCERFSRFADLKVRKALPAKIR